MLYLVANNISMKKSVDFKKVLYSDKLENIDKNLSNLLAQKKAAAKTRNSLFFEK